MNRLIGIELNHTLYKEYMAQQQLVVREALKRLGEDVGRLEGLVRRFFFYWAIVVRVPDLTLCVSGWIGKGSATSTRSYGSGMGETTQAVADGTYTALAAHRLFIRRGNFFLKMTHFPYQLTRSRSKTCVLFPLLDHHGETFGSCAVMSTPCRIGIYGSHTGFERTSNRGPWTVAHQVEELEWGLATATVKGKRRFTSVQK